MDQAEFRNLKFLFEPCQTADELDRYLRYWLQLDLPWDTVDPDSTSAPLKFVWEVYRVLLTGEGPHVHVVASARGCQKTLTSSTLQYLSMLHFRRDGVHIAAQLQQSQQAIDYLDKFMNIPELEPYKTKDNVKVKIFTGLPANDLTDKSDAKLRVITATKSGTNSSRSSFLTFDEVDLTPTAVLEEAAWIATPTRDGRNLSPVFLYLSSRKSNSGPIQQMVDEIEKGDVDKRLHKWSSSDFLKVCPPSVHKPELGASKAYIHTDTLKVIWGEEDYKATVNEAAQSQYKELKVFEGCKTCPIFIPCLGYSVNQRGESFALRNIKDTKTVIGQIKDPSNIIAQGLNWKPESSGLIYSMFSRYRHLKDPIDFYKWTVGERYNPQNLSHEQLDNIEQNGSYGQIHSITPSKRQIHQDMVKKGWTFVGGVDFGHSPDPAVTLIVGYHKRHKRCAVLTLESENGFANHLWAEHSCHGILSEFPVDFVAPDCVPDKAAPTYFGKHGVRSLDTKPSRIEPGVSFVRGLLWNAYTQSSNFAVLDDCETDNKNIMFVEAMEKWSHEKGPLGYNMHKFADDEFTHTNDALRYALTPFIEVQTIGISFAQRPDITGNLPMQTIVGDAASQQQAKEIIEEQNRVKSILLSRMQKDFGVTGDPFAGQGQAAPNTKPASSGIRFKF